MTIRSVLFLQAFLKQLPGPVGHCANWLCNYADIGPQHGHPVAVVETEQRHFVREIKIKAADGFYRAKSGNVVGREDGGRSLGSAEFLFDCAAASVDVKATRNHPRPIGEAGVGKHGPIAFYALSHVGERNRRHHECDVAMTKSY